MICDLGNIPPEIKVLNVEDLTKSMEEFIKVKPRFWKEILENYHGQPYPNIYRAFGNLRHRIGRANDATWYRYTFSDHDFAFENRPLA